MSESICDSIIAYPYAKSKHFTTIFEKIFFYKKDYKS